MDPLIPFASKPALHLTELKLFLDAHRKHPFGFVSHAHADHFARHERILCSPATGHLLQKRFRVAKNRLQILDYHQVLALDDYEIKLLPAGHIYGSAMLHATRLSDGSTLLYTGDYKLHPSLTSETCELQQADLLIMETTFGRPQFIFPSREKIHEEIVAFVRSALEKDEQPILLGYSIGKAQEAIAILQEASIPTLAYKTVAEMSLACHEAGLAGKPPPHFEEELPAGHALVAPPNVIRSKNLKKLKNPRTAMLSGWALTSGARYRYRADAIFPLSDHADYNELLKTVEIVQPKKVITIHGSTREFAADLRRRGVEAWSIYGNDQLEFTFGS